MFNIKYIIEEDYILKKLKKKNILKQYKKAKSNIVSGNTSGNQIRYRRPKKDKIIYFRINIQYRALCRLENNTLIVFDIDDHN